MERQGRQEQLGQQASTVSTAAEGGWFVFEEPMRGSLAGSSSHPMDQQTAGFAVQKILERTFLHV